MQNFVGSILGAIFGVVWMIFALYIGAGAFSLVGLIFIAMAIMNAVYHYKNATGDNRYSTYDIVDSSEETDPFNEKFGKQNQTGHKSASDLPGIFCPYCGTKLGDGFVFCNKCGKRQLNK